MSKYIDVEQTEKIAKGLFSGTVGITFSQAVHALLEAVEPADVEPVVHAHYIIDFLGDSSCSQCGEKFLDSTYKRCPNCGAHMDDPEDTTNA